VVIFHRKAFISLVSLYDSRELCASPPPRLQKEGGHTKRVSRLIKAPFTLPPPQQLSLWKRLALFVFSSSPTSRLLLTKMYVFCLFVGRHRPRGPIARRQRRAGPPAGCPNTLQPEQTIRFVVKRETSSFLSPSLQSLIIFVQWCWNETTGHFSLYVCRLSCLLMPIARAYWERKHDFWMIIT